MRYHLNKGVLIWFIKLKLKYYVHVEFVAALGIMLVQEDAIG